MLYDPPLGSESKLFAHFKISAFKCNFKYILFSYVIIVYKLFFFAYASNIHNTTQVNLEKFMLFVLNVIL